MPSGPSDRSPRKRQRIDFAGPLSAVAFAKTQIEPLRLRVMVEDMIVKALMARSVGFAFPVTSDIRMSVVDVARIREAANATPTEAKRHLREAQDDLRHSEAHLRNAEDDLRDSEAHLRQAKTNLNDADGRNVTRTYVAFP